MPMISFLVSKFEKQTLSNLVTECFGSDFPDILQKQQVSYIYNYLDTLDAQSVLLELNYLDKDYLKTFPAITSSDSVTLGISARGCIFSPRKSIIGTSIGS